MTPSTPSPSPSPAPRKSFPLASGVLDYFPSALFAVARVSAVANAQHNPGEPMHWARSKSFDHADALMRHLVDRGGIDSDGLRHSAKVAWRALALLQEELEASGASPGRASRFEARPPDADAFLDPWDSLEPWPAHASEAPHETF